ncbi:MAG: molybdopterin-dependent oxidoreductase [Candidatus Angelobacter sp.]
MKRAGAAWGLVAGACVTAPLIAIFFIANRLAGLPLVPFDVFDWLTRILPGPILTFGIDSIVKLVHAFHMGATATAAKAAEQTLAIAITAVAGIVAGAVFFALRRTHRSHSFAPGIILGALAGVAFAAISHSVNHSAAASPLASFVWILAMFVAWGIALNWIYLRLSGTSTTNAVDDENVVKLNRRQFMVRVGGAAAVITVAGAALGELAGGTRTQKQTKGARWSASHPLPNADAAVKPVFGTRPEYTPLEQHYRIDIDTMPPVIHESDWKLKVGGLVEKPLELTLADLRDKYQPTDQFVTLSCISNPVGGDLTGTTRWTGVSLQRLLPELALKKNATHLKITSADGFYESVALEAIRSDARIMLAYAWDGVPLLAQHGFPLRIYIPDLYGMKQPKWITAVEAMDHAEPGYWVVRDWDARAQMRSTSVIDAVDKKNLVQRNGQTLVPIGGIAHAGARGISKVEVSVDDGPWQPAQLRTPMSGLTWVIWRYEWPFQAGRHTIAVRCFDGNGAAQMVEVNPPHPSGATGIYRVTAKIETTER